MVDEEALDGSEEPALHHVHVAAGIVVLEHVVHVPGRVDLPQAHRPLPDILGGRLLVVPGLFEQADQDPPRVHFFMELRAARRLARE
ncbi:hypothetical protein [Streptomyces sp. NPDC051001]|uniref:hypothetical protein n=1 Tax=Streptomyces sp. NPDC051001 TaxID=3155795 RepID=UPI003438631E